MLLFLQAPTVLGPPASLVLSLQCSAELGQGGNINNVYSRVHSLVFGCPIHVATQDGIDTPQAELRGAREEAFGHDKEFTSQ
jgi:hypothetical protein